MNNKVVAMEMLTYKKYDYDKSLEGMSLEMARISLITGSIIANVSPYALFALAIYLAGQDEIIFFNQEKQIALAYVFSCLVAVVTVYPMLLLGNFHSYNNDISRNLGKKLSDLYNQRQDVINFKNNLENILSFPPSQQRTQTLLKLFLDSRKYLELLSLSEENFKDNIDVVKLVLNKVSPLDVVKVMGLVSVDVRKNNDIVKLALNKVSGLADIKAVMGLAKFDAWNDKELVKLVLNKVSGLADIKAVMGLAKFDAWSYKELVQRALSRVNSLSDVVNVMKLAGTDVKMDKEVVKLALSKASGSEVIEVMKLAEEVVRKDDELVKVALCKVYGLDDIKAVMELAKFDAWNDKELVTILLNRSYGTDVVRVMQLAGVDVRNDKELVMNATNSSNYHQIFALIKAETIKTHRELATKFAELFIDDSIGSEQVKSGSHKEENGSYVETETHHPTQPYIDRTPSWQGDGTYREVDDYETEYFIKDTSSLMKTLQEKLYFTEAEAKEMVAKIFI